MTALSEAAGGERLPTLAITLAYVGACGGDQAEWETRWHALAGELATKEQAAQPLNGDSPYLGLATFEPEDASRFFGRQKVVDDLRARVESETFTAVFGASGSGKSSVLRAGLLPCLDPGDWVTVLLTPGRRPLEELAIRLANAAGIAASGVLAELTGKPDSIRLLTRQIQTAKPAASRILIVVDQFEEIFTLCQDAGERTIFVECLLAAAGGKVRVVLGVRADFFAQCAHYPRLVAALQDRQMLIGPMDADGLRAVIRQPAVQANVRVEAALVEAIVADAHGEPGALPLVSHALYETWRRRTGDTMTFAAYLKAGGVQRAIAHTAEQAYEKLDENAQVVARQIFLRLTALGQGTEDTRRRVTTDELLGTPDSEAVAVVLADLSAARLVTMNEDTVEVAHEALIRSWPRLRTWLADDREHLVNHRRLTDAADEWSRAGQDDGMLYRGLRLMAWDGQSLDQLNRLEKEFLTASRRRVEHERATARRRNRRLLIGLVAGLVVLAILAAVAWFQTAQAEAGRTLALSRQLAATAKAQLQLDPELALLLAKRAYATSPTQETEDILRQAALESRALATFSGHGDQVTGISFSADGRYLATGGADGAVRVWQRQPGPGPRDPVVLKGHTGNVWTPVFSPDGKTVAAGGVDGKVTVWNWTQSGEPVVLGEHESAVWAVALSPDGRRVASISEAGTVRIWNVDRSGEPIVLKGHEGRTLGVAFSPDGKRLASSGGDATVRVWDLSDSAEPIVLRGHQDSVEAVAFGPDGRHLATASTDGTVRTWDLTSLNSTILGSHDGTAEGVAYSRDGFRVVSNGNDGTVRIWNAAQRAAPLVLRGHRGTVNAVAISPDGRQVGSVGEDGTARIWDATEVGGPQVLRGHTGPSWWAVPDPAGSRVASASADGTIRIWALAGSAPPAVLEAHKGDALSVAFSPATDDILSTGRQDRVARIWTGTRERLVLKGHEGAIWTGMFSPDGQRVVTGSSDGTIRIWSTRDGAELTVLRGDQGAIRGLAISPDGQQIAGAAADGTVRIWDLTRGGDPQVLRGHQGMVWAVAFSPDGKRVVSGGNDGSIRIWSLTGPGEPVVLNGHQGIVWSVAVSPDGQRLASNGNDGTTRIWRSSGSGDPVVVKGFGASAETTSFMPDGRLVTTHDDGSVRVWACRACGPVEDVLRLADEHLTRDFTVEERRVYLNETGN